MNRPLFLLAISFLWAPSAPAQNDPSGGINLSGVWMDNGKAVEVKQSGISIEARFINPPMCDPRDGSTPRPRETDFTGTLEGNVIKGKVTVCNWGKGWGAQIGVQEVDMKLEVSADQKTLSGTYEGHKGPQGVSLTRCPQSPYEPTREEIARVIFEELRARGNHPPMSNQTAGPPVPAIIVTPASDKDPAVRKYEFVAPLTDRPIQGTSRLGVVGSISFRPCDESKEIKIAATFVHDAENGPRGEDALRGWKGEGYEYSPRGLRRAVGDARDGLRVPQIPRPPS